MECPRCKAKSLTRTIRFDANIESCVICGFYHATPGSTMSRDRQLGRPVRLPKVTE